MVASLLKDSLIGGIASSENPIEFAVEIGVPLLEAHVSQLDASAIGWLLGAIADIPEKLAALELAACLLRGARRDACGQVSSTALSRLAESPVDADRREIETARRRLLGVASSRVGEFSATTAACVEALVATLAEILEGEIFKVVSPAPVLELYAALARSYSSVAARRGLDRAESKLIATFLGHSERRTRCAAVAVLSQLWRKAASLRARSAAEDLCRKLVDALALSPADHDVSAVVVFTRRLESLTDATCEALGAIARDGDDDAGTAQEDAGRALEGLSAALDAAVLASRGQSSGQLIMPTIKSTRFKLLETSLKLLGPSLARRKASRLAKIALADEVVAVGLAARTLGSGVGLEKSTTNLVAQLSAFVLPESSSSSMTTEEETVEDDRHKSRRNKRRKIAVVRKNRRRDGSGSLGTVENATTCFETLTALLYACSTNLDDIRRDPADKLAADVFKLASQTPDHDLVFWRHATLRVAALRFAKAALAAPTSSGDRPNFVDLASVCCASLFDADSRVADVVAEIRCLVDTLLRPRAPPFRPARLRAQLDDTPLVGEDDDDEDGAPQARTELAPASAVDVAQELAESTNRNAVLDETATREDREMETSPVAERNTAAVVALDNPARENVPVPPPAPAIPSATSSAVRTDDPMEDEHGEESRTALSFQPPPPEAISPAPAAQDEDDELPDIVTTIIPHAVAATEAPAIVSQPPEESSPTVLVPDDDDDDDEFPEIISS